MGSIVFVKCGTHVASEIGNVRGIVTCVSIRFDKINYEISYFLNGEYKNVWLDRNEFSIKDFKGELIVGY